MTQINDYSLADTHVADYVGRSITAAELQDDAFGGRVFLTFEDGEKVRIFDDGQSCCERRYITTDDDLSDLVGHTLRHVLVKDGPEVEEEYEVHETCFVEIGTDVGCVTLTTHNEHNGYYGGFSLNFERITN